jgi:hypothetical protein
MTVLANASSNLTDRRQHGSRGVYILRSHYQATNDEDMEKFMGAAVQRFVECVDL